MSTEAFAFLYEATDQDLLATLRGFGVFYDAEAFEAAANDNEEDEGYGG